MKLLQQRLAPFAAGHVAKQFQTENAIYRVRRQADGKRRALKGLDPLEQRRRVMGAGVVEHVLGVIRGEDDPVDVFGQHRPEPPRTAGQVEDQTGLAGHLEGIAHQPPVTPRRQTLTQPRRARIAADPGVLTITAFGVFNLDGRKWVVTTSRAHVSGNGSE